METTVLLTSSNRTDGTTQTGALQTIIITANVLQPTPSAYTSLNNHLINFNQMFDEDKLLIYRELYYTGFSSLIAARDLATGTAVVAKRTDLKHLSHGVLTKQQIEKLRHCYVEKIIKVINCVKGLGDQNIINRLIEFTPDPRQLILVSEMCQSGDLFNWILLQSKLRLKDICLVIQYLSQALAFLHRNKIVHGNLMPTHILFHTISPQSLTLMMDVSIRAELHSVTGQNLGIFDCYSPELTELALERSYAVKANNLDINKFDFETSFLTSDSDLLNNMPETNQQNIVKTVAMDMWAVAIIGLIALTGKAPFQCHNLVQLRKAIHSKGTLSPLNNKILDRIAGDGLKRRFARLLQLDPADRANAEEAANLGWVDAEKETENTTGNLLYLIEFSLVSTCQRYRLSGRTELTKLMEMSKLKEKRRQAKRYQTTNKIWNLEPMLKYPNNNVQSLLAKLQR